MTVRVLQSKAEIRSARDQLKLRGVSFTEDTLLSRLRTSGLIPTKAIHIGHYVKSWDIEISYRFLLDNVEKDGCILDIGSLASEIVCVLHRSGYHKVFAVDLDRRLSQMPFRNSVNYCVSDFLRAPFRDSSFDAITAISVIEHGFRRAELLDEIARLLRPGGFFVASFDYWPEKIDTDDVKIFGMDWTIFSRQEVVQFLEEAGRYGLVPCGSIELEASESVYAMGGRHRRYTFGWCALRKGPSGAG